MNHFRIATIGFGEAARAFVSGWTRDDAAVISTFDVKLLDPSEVGHIIDACVQLNVSPQSAMSDAVSGVDLVFSLVTADQSLIAAKAAASSIKRGALYFDCNSCSPATKVSAAELIEAAGGRYVDVAVMSPVYPARQLTPLLVSGRNAEDGILALTRLGMVPQWAGSRIGEASSVKMLRSVVIKGIEALTAEAMLAARRAGVEDAVLASLQASDPGIDWRKRMSYNLERMMVHGLRRSAEMREVAATVSELGLPSRVSTATADWQRQVAELRLPAGADDLASRADMILAAIDMQKTKS